MGADLRERRAWEAEKEEWRAWAPRRAWEERRRARRVSSSSLGWQTLLTDDYSGFLPLEEDLQTLTLVLQMIRKTSS